MDIIESATNKIKLYTFSFYIIVLLLIIYVKKYVTSYGYAFIIFNILFLFLHILFLYFEKHLYISAYKLEKIIFENNFKIEFNLYSAQSVNSLCIVGLCGVNKIMIIPRNFFDMSFDNIVGYLYYYNIKHNLKFLEYISTFSYFAAFYKFGKFMKFNATNQQMYFIFIVLIYIFYYSDFIKLKISEYAFTKSMLFFNSQKNWPLNDIFVYDVRFSFIIDKDSDAIYPAYKTRDVAITYITIIVSFFIYILMIK